MKRIVIGATLIVLVAVLAAGIYAALGYRDALTAAPQLRTRADGLIAAELGGDGLGAGRQAMMIKVQDPGFAAHSGVDFRTPGAGATTLTQSLSKRLAFDAFRPGLAKLRQTGFALGLEQRLNKDQILALWLDTVPMGRGPEGWMIGLFPASVAIYGRTPLALTDTEFLRLIAVVIAPSRFDLTVPDVALEERLTRISRLLRGLCAPRDHGDVWLEGCGP